MTQNIVLTGSARGIGAAIAHSLTRPDVQLFAATRDHADLGAPDGADRLWHAALEALDGRVDILINNAGIFEASPISQDDATWRADWRRTMAINLDAASELCRHAVLHMQERGAGGRIINIASRAAHRGDSPDHWHYAASKGGMVAMTKTIARAYAAQNILAFAVCPGFTMTGMAEEYLANRGGDTLLADIPLGRVADPQEVADIVRFLAIEAPASLTGATLDVNGASYVR